MAAAAAFAQSFCCFPNSHQYHISPTRCLNPVSHLHLLLLNSQKPTNLKPLKAEGAPSDGTSSPLPLPLPDSSTTIDASPFLPQSRKQRRGLTFLWNARIKGFVDEGRYDEAVDSYRKMQALGVRADHFTFPFVLKACACRSFQHEVLRVHGELIKCGLDSDVYVCNSLIAAYYKLGNMESAERVFDKMPVRDLVSWNSVMNGHVSSGDGSKALWCLQEMQESYGMKVDRFSIIAALAACSLENCLIQGKEIQCHVLRHGFESDLMVQTSVLDMYCKCHDMISSERLFERMESRNVVAWNALIAGYGLNDRPEEAVRCLIKMQKEDIAPDTVTMVNFLPCCAQLESICDGKAVHCFTIRNALLPNLVVETALINMYGKCAEIGYAERLFAQMAERSLVSWNAMITTYVQNDQSNRALKVFLDFLEKDINPDRFTISALLSAYTKIALLWHGRQIHGYAVKLGYGSATLALNSIMYMYAKCGDLQSSRKAFDAISKRDVISWNTMIMAYAIHGQGKTALELYSEMQRNGFQPNSSTFVSVLSACSISGLVDEAWMHFNSMQHDYSIAPQIEHYGCMADILGRKGDLELAESFIKRMPLAPTARIWGSLLTASRNHNNIELAERVADNIFTFEHDNTGCYILLSNMYADAERWDDVERLKCQMKKEGLQKITILSIVEHNSHTYSFTNGDRSHPETNNIHAIADIFSRHIGETTCDRGTTIRLPEAILKQASSPSRHSVRLAVCHGLISSRVETPVLVKKNVRICNSCHHAIKSISKLSRREIVVGDSRIYHHFRDGKCSCRDYW